MKLTLIFFILLMTTLHLNAQTEEMIEAIRKHYRYVETNINNFELVNDTTFEGSTDGATIRSYFDDGGLIKIRIEYLGETGKLHREFYIDEQQLLFVFDQEFHYNMPYYIDSEQAQEMGFEEGFDPAKTKKLQHRYYFYNNKMIRWINPAGEHQASENSEWLEKQKYYLGELAKLR